MELVFAPSGREFDSRPPFGGLKANSLDVALLAANYRAAKHGQTKAVFISKLAVSC